MFICPLVLMDSSDNSGANVSFFPQFKLGANLITIDVTSR